MKSPEARKLEGVAEAIGALAEDFYHGGTAEECWEALANACAKADPECGTEPGEFFAWLSERFVEHADAEEAWYVNR